MKKLRLLARASLLILAVAVHSFADDRWIVRVHPSVANDVARQTGATIDKKVRSSDDVYVFSVPKTAAASSVISKLKSHPLVQNIEKNSDVVLPELRSTFDKSRRHIPFLKGGTRSITMPGNPWAPYLNQAPNYLIGVQDAQKEFGYGSSGITVAVIDTGVDYTHPVLAPVLATQYARNFITNSGDASVSQETTPWVDQETTPWVDGSGSVVLNQETTPWVDQETTPWVDQETTPWVDKLGAAYGHGTMVAGIIHLVAPNVRIMPLKAFTSDGSGTIADVIEAIDWAVAHGVTAINMSFSASDTSAELDKAIADATAANVICVAAVANDGAPVVVYPSNIKPTIGVGSTSITDYRSSFSNYGSDVDIAAPGEGIITTFPRNHYAAGWGTSFATPYVTGTIALMRSINRTETPGQADADLTNAADNIKSWSVGRLDVKHSVDGAKD